MILVENFMQHASFQKTLNITHHSSSIDDTNHISYVAMAQNYQPPKWMVFLLNMIRNLWVIGTIILSHCHLARASCGFYGSFGTARIVQATLLHGMERKAQPTHVARRRWDPRVANCDGKLTQLWKITIVER